jgi:hypothetical protein
MLVSMGFWSRLRAAIRRETGELRDVARGATERADAAMTERERELDATPEERLRLEQERAARADDEFEAVRRRIEGEPGV